jgi:creatinine amidohydrolase
MQFLRPGQLEKALRDFPAVYVPFGLIEWHGRHLPLGNDALKAHAILVKVAEQFGGVVYPPVYFHDGFPQESLVPVLTALFQRLKKIGAIRILRDIFDKMMFPLESSVASSNS